MPLGLLLLLLTVFLGWIFYKDYEVSEQVKEAGQALAIHQLDNARRLFQMVEEIEPWRPLGWAELARQYLEDGNTDQALQILEIQGSRGFLDTYGWLLLADAYGQSGKDSRIEASLQEAYQQAETIEEQVNTLQAFTAYYRSRQEYQKAINCLHDQIALSPVPDRQITTELVLLNTVLDPVYGYSLSESDRSKPQWLSDWQAGLKNALKYEREDLRQLEIGRAFAAFGIWDLAEYSFQKVVEKTPDFADAWAFLAEARQQQGKDGREQIEKALMLEPESPAVRLTAVLYYRRQKDYPRAIDLLKNPGSEVAGETIWQLELARTLAEAGRLEEASDTYEDIIQNDPENAEAFISLARMCLQYEYRLYDLAMSLAEKAVQLKPDSAEALDVLGQVFFALGESEKAFESFDQAREIDPAYAPVWLHVGQMQLAGADPSSAKVALQKTIDLSANSYEGKIASRLLKQYFNINP